MECDVLAVLKLVNANRIRSLSFSDNSLQIAFFPPEEEEQIINHDIDLEEAPIVYTKEEQDKKDAVADARPLTEDDLDMLLITDPEAYERIQGGILND